MLKVAGFIHKSFRSGCKNISKTSFIVGRINCKYRKTGKKDDLLRYQREEISASVITTETSHHYQYR